MPQTWIWLNKRFRDESCPFYSTSFRNVPEAPLLELVTLITRLSVDIPLQEADGIC